MLGGRYGIFSCLQPTLVDYHSILSPPYLSSICILSCALSPWPRPGRISQRHGLSSLVAAGHRTPAVSFYSRAHLVKLSLLDNLHSELSQVFIKATAWTYDREYDGSTGLTIKTEVKLLFASFVRDSG